MFSKISVVLALVCWLCVPGAWAQSAGGRVGPVEDVPASMAGAGESKPVAKPAPKAGAKKDGAAKKTKPEAVKKDESKREAHASEQPGAATPLTAVVNTPGEKPQTNSTTDAPPKTSASPAPVREAAPVGLIPPSPTYVPPAPLNASESTGTTTNTKTPVSAPNAAAPAPLSSTIYRVGVGDMLDIRLINGTGHESTLYTILTGGLLDYPLAGEPVSVAGLTSEEIATRLSAELKRRGIFDRAQFQVSVRDYTSHTVMVSGLVDQPGAKVLRREAVPLYVVLADALPRADAGRAVIIARANGMSKTVDLGDPAALNELVAAGDVVNVQTRPPEFFYIGGLVAAPGQKDFHIGLTLTQAILASGGVASSAGNNKSKVSVTVSRQGADGRLVPIVYLLNEIEAGKIPDPHLQPGDRIEIGRKH